MEAVSAVVNKTSGNLQKNFTELLRDGKLADEISSIKLDRIEDEWKNFIKGKLVNTSVVSQQIFESWQRSMEYGVDPYFSLQQYLSVEDIRTQIANRKTLVSRFGDVIVELQNLAREKGWIIQLFDKNAKHVQLIGYAAYLRKESSAKYTVPIDVSETHVGTNAVNLALRENKPIQILGPQHYNYYLHNVYCSAAPVHNSQGEILGAINIYSYSKKHTIETLYLVTFLANISFIIEALEELDSYASAINDLPQGIVFLNHRGEIKCYNNRIIDMLKIDGKNSKEELLKVISALESFGKGYFENKEIYLDVHNIKKNFLVSTKKLMRPNNLLEEKIIFLEPAAKEKQKVLGNGATYTFDDIIGNNTAIKTAKDLSQKIAKASSTVLLFGESGTGKELFAQAIHNASVRKDKPFVAINCGAIPYELVESELFGYAPGAFTGALKNGKVGKLELASGGTLFLDEIESMPVPMQIKLLRAFSTNQICRVGGVEEIPINVRLISATKKDLLQEADNGNFREDLYYRISTFIIELPALHERSDDIPLLAKHFINKFAEELTMKEFSIDPEFFDALSYHHWRGNVRELYNVIERTVVLLGDAKELTLSYLPEKIIQAYQYRSLKSKLYDIKNTKPSSNNLMKISEEILIELLLDEEAGNLSKIATRMGISRPTLYNKINNSKKVREKFQRYVEASGEVK